MANVIIQRIAFDADGQLRVYPPGRENYLYIWRAAKSVRWDDEDRSLYVLPVEDFTVVDDFNQIIKAVREEYGVRLVIGETTAFDLPAEMVAQLGKIANQTPPS